MPVLELSETCAVEIEQAEAYVLRGAPVEDPAGMIKVFSILLLEQRAAIHHQAQSLAATIEQIAIFRASAVDVEVPNIGKAEFTDRFVAAFLAGADAEARKHLGEISTSQWALEAADGYFADVTTRADPEASAANELTLVRSS